jgi:hypothetical protein
MVSMKRHEQGNWIDDDHGWVAPATERGSIAQGGRR